MPRRKRPAKPPAASGREIVRPPPNGHRRAVLAWLALAAVGFTAVWWALSRDGTQNAPNAPTHLPPPEDPRLTIATPFLNVRPEIGYMGDEACAGCHRELTNSYRQHPMGSSLAPIASVAVTERFDADARNPFETSGFVYRVDRRGSQVFHQEAAGAGAVKAEAEIAFAVGSGRRGRSYLIARDDYLFQSPISWYPLKGIWDLSPGYDESNLHFNRPVIAACLFCHSNQAEPDGRAANRFRAPLFRGHAIGCERCHGPGELHVRRQSEGGGAAGVDYTIVNPRHLDHGLREAVCQQCHLQGEARVLPRGRAYFEYRPGLPLHRFVADFVRPADQRHENKFVGTVEQMYASRCFQQSSGDGKLGCISCHDPHALPAPEQRVAFYRDRCLTCHADRGCRLPRPARLTQSPDDSCIACHMPSRGSSIRHAAMTDHAIPRHGDRANVAPKTGDWPRPGQLPLVPFPRELLDNEETDLRRNLGLALIEVAGKQRAAAASRAFAELALPLLDSATAGDPRDADAGEAQATALLLVHRPEAAFAACLAILDHFPERETTLFRAASVAAMLNRPAQARALSERAIKVNPWMWHYRQMLAEAYAREGDPAKAAEACRKVLELQPANLAARMLLVRCYVALGERARAHAQRDACLAVMPAAERESFRRWWELQVGPP